MDTEQKIRQKEQQTEQNETPTLAVDDDGGDDDASSSSSSGGFGAIPTPSLSKKHLALIGAVVAAIIIWKLYQRGSSSSGQEWTAPEVDDDDGVDEPGDIEVTPDQANPLAADQQVAEAFRKRGIINGDD